MTGLLLSGELEPTAGYAVRSYQWLQTMPGEGVLTVRQRRTSGAQEEADVYAVEEQSTPALEVREFILVNVTDDEQPDAYRVFLGPRGDDCTCKAGQVRHSESCKHRDALRTILQLSEAESCTT